MAYSYVTYTGNGVTVNYSVPFTYIQKTDVEVYVNNVLKTVTTDYTWPNTTSITFNVAPANGAEIKIKRNTTKASKLVDFTDGSILSSTNLDLSADQMLYVVQELYDSSLTNVEGTWTPVLSPMGDTVLSNKVSKYTKVGNVVICTFTFKVDSSTQSGFPVLSLASLPFTINTYVSGNGIIDLGGGVLGWNRAFNTSVGNTYKTAFLYTI